MSCFWDTLSHAIIHPKLQPIRKKYDLPNNRRMNPKAVATFFKQNNIKTINVEWQSEKLTDKQLEENKEAIKDYDKKTVHKGYLCSTFDPFIFLLAELFEITIEHKYMQTTIIYKNTKKTRATIRFRSNNAHIDYV